MNNDKPLDITDLLRFLDSLIEENPDIGTTMEEQLPGSRDYLALFISCVDPE